MCIAGALLLIVLFTTCIYCSFTDIRDGIIKNKVLLGSGVLCCGLNFVYYFFFGRQYFTIFFLDFVVLVILSVIMYALNLWAAGDSELLFLIVFAIPARYYDANMGIAPAFFVIVFTFSISFIYIVLESIVLRVKNKDKLHFPLGRNILHFLRDYVYISAYFQIFSHSCGCFVQHLGVHPLWVALWILPAKFQDLPLCGYCPFLSLHIRRI